MSKKLTSKMTVLFQRYLTFESICDIADRGAGWDYNRQLCSEKVRKLPPDRIFPVVFILLHEHRQGQPSEPHMRLMIGLPGCNGFADVPLEYFERLPIGLMVMKGNQPIVAAIPEDASVTLKTLGTKQEIRSAFALLRRQYPDLKRFLANASKQVHNEIFVG